MNNQRVIFLKKITLLIRLFNKIYLAIKVNLMAIKLITVTLIANHPYYKY